MAAAPCDHHAADRPATASARFAGALVNAQAQLVIAGAALDVNVVPEACCPGASRRGRGLSYRSEEAAGFQCGNPAGLRQRMDAGHKERLVRVDVAGRSPRGFDRLGAAREIAQDRRGARKEFFGSAADRRNPRHVGLISGISTRS